MNGTRQKARRSKSWNECRKKVMKENHEQYKYVLHLYRSCLPSESRESRKGLRSMHQ